MSEKKQCAVSGLLKAPMPRMPGAMCGYIIVSGKLCDYAGQCEHQRDVEPRQTAAQQTQGGE